MNSRSFRGKGKPGSPELPIVPNCTLERMRASGCIGLDCRKCGWNKDEAARRKNLIHRRGLTYDKEIRLNRLVVTARGVR